MLKILILFILTIDCYSSANSTKLGFNYINRLRVESGLVPFKYDKLLEKAAIAHSNYSVSSNDFDHIEHINSDSYFSGREPLDRVLKQGYASRFVGENYSAGNKNIVDSVSKLFSAIYHRFGFLDFNFDLIGIGYKPSENSSNKFSNVYVYNMGSSYINSLCKKKYKIVFGSYNYGICKNSKKNIPSSRYNKYKNYLKSMSPEIVIYPNNNQKNILTTFYEEQPDPLPQCSISGYPISIEFNDINNNSYTLNSFKLYDLKINREVKDTIFLSSKNDVNHKFTKNQYALFPKRKLEFDRWYGVKVSYSKDGRSYKKEWKFKTKDLPNDYYKISKSSKLSYKIKAGSTTTFYIVPKNCKDTVNRVSLEYDKRLTVSYTFENNSITLKVGNYNMFFDNKVKIELSNGLYFYVEVVRG